MQTTHHRIYKITWVPGGECVVHSVINHSVVDWYKAGAWEDTGRLPDDVRAAAMAARPLAKEYADDYAPNGVFDPGDRVELHPGLDLWARGARCGTVRGIDKATGHVKIRMDNRSVRKLVRLFPDRIRHVR